MRPRPSLRALWVGVRCGLLGHKWQEIQSSIRDLRACRRCGYLEAGDAR